MKANRAPRKHSPSRATGATQSGESECPVAKIAYEIYRMSEVYEAAERAVLDAPSYDFGLSKLVNVSGEFREGLMEWATFLRPTSPMGALLQLSLIYDFTEELGAITDPASKATISEEMRMESRKLTSKINRLTYALAEYVEGVAGDTLDKEVAEKLLPRRLSPFATLDEATRRDGA
ncbi:hypothetical protein ACNHKD_08390 [Methylocystis sp. JAN1]|uniref:hypothetical protein n=1 Tax=Methylocystis sp. JAN1 TaxID=3397211 RepID=UPI003FA2982C